MCISRKPQSGRDRKVRWFVFTQDHREAEVTRKASTEQEHLFLKFHRWRLQRKYIAVGTDGYNESRDVVRGEDDELAEGQNTVWPLPDYIYGLQRLLHSTCLTPWTFLMAWLISLLSSFSSNTIWRDVAYKNVSKQPITRAYRGREGTALSIRVQRHLSCT